MIIFYVEIFLAAELIPWYVFNYVNAQNPVLTVYSSCHLGFIYSIWYNERNIMLISLRVTDICILWRPGLVIIIIIVTAEHKQRQGVN